MAAPAGDPLPTILERIGLSHLTKTFEENLLTVNEVSAMNDTDFAKVGVTAIGSRIRIKQAVEDFKRANGCNTSLAVAKYLDLQQKKKTKTLKNVASKKSTRRVRVGWKHLVKAGKYKVMTLKEGGGQQVVDLDKDMSLYEATKQIVDIYFPGGKSLVCSLSDINFHLASFNNEPILGSSERTTVGDYFESVKSHPVRWYLHTKMKTSSDEDSGDELQDIQQWMNRRSTEGNVQNDGHNESAKVITHQVQGTSAELDKAEENSSRISPDLTEMEVTEDSGTPTVIFQRRRPQFVRRSRESTSVKTTSDTYRSYLDLIVLSSSSDDDESVERRPEPPEREVNLYEILSGLKPKVNSEKCTKVNVTRRSPIEGFRRALRRTDFNPENRLSVKFADDYGQAEGAVDVGGPMRELFRLVLREVRDSVVFTGEETARIISINAKALREGLYRDIGELLAMAIVHGGQWPSYFHPVSYKSFAVGTEQATPGIDDIPDIDVRYQINKLQRSTSIEELQDCVDANYALFSISGCLPPLREFSIELRDQHVNDIVNFIVVGKNVPAINQFMEGLSALGIAQSVTKYPEQFKEVFCFTEKKLTADAIEAVFQKVNYSEIGTNKRSIEEKTMTHWCDYLMDIEDGKAEITMKELLAFGTGTDMIPYLGFHVDPAIEFSHIHCYPMANTCAMILRIPVHKDYEAFKEHMDFGIRNSPGFGIA